MVLRTRRRAASANCTVLRSIAASLFAATVGCGFVPKTQLNSAETQARILNEQNKAQLAEIANLKAHNRKLEDQLLAAEKELAASERRTDSDRKRLANFQTEREQVQQHVEQLVRGAKLTGVTPVRDDDVERLLRKYPLLRFDSLTGAYKLEAEINFAGEETRITPESEKLLAEFAQALAQPEAGELRVMVVGRGGDAKAVGSGDEYRRGTEQALAVAGYLRKIGLRADQIGVSSLAPGESRPAKDAVAADPAKTRRVEIFVVGKRMPVVGWDQGVEGRF